MGHILNFGFVALVLAGAVRYFSSNQLGVHFFDYAHVYNWEAWLYGVSVLWFCVSFWNVLLRRRCPNCRSHQYSHNGSKEIDRWVGSKKIREQIGDKSYGYRSVTTTFIKIKDVFQCLHCNHVWSEISKQEKT